jgi:4-hydroxy-tetrahydrodipicolinate synthase
MVGGTTGEFVAMDEEQRRRTLEVFVEAMGGRLRVVAHTGHADLQTARRLTGHAGATGVDAVAILCPYYYPTTTGAAKQYLRDLAELVPDTAVVVYNFPRNTTNAFPDTAFEELTDLPNLAGAKCSVETFDELRSYLRFEPEFRIICGNDALLAEFVRAGGRAIVSGNAAAYPELIQRSVTRALDGTWGSNDADLVADIAYASRAGAPDRLKELLHARGVHTGTARIRTFTASDVAADGNDQAQARVERELARVVVT